MNNIARVFKIKLKLHLESLNNKNFFGIVQFILLMSSSKLED